MAKYIVRSDKPDQVVTARGYVDAVIKSGVVGDVTVEGPSYYVTFDVDEHSVSEIDREAKR